MSRDVGQIRAREALVAGFAIALAAVALIAGMQALLRPVQRLPAAETPAPTAPASPCPYAHETLPRPPPASPSIAERRSAGGAGSLGDPVAVTSGELMECPAAFDGQEVVYQGEVVRAVLHRGERAWVQLNDDVYGLEIGPLPRHRSPQGVNSGIPVSIPAADADRISFVGSGSARGDRLVVEGTFLRADPADAGGPAIQARTVQIVAVGEPVTQRMTPARLIAALLLAAAAVGMAGKARRSQRR